MRCSMGNVNRKKTPPPAHQSLKIGCKEEKKLTIHTIKREEMQHKSAVSGSALKLSSLNYSRALPTLCN